MFWRTVGRIILVPLALVLAAVASVFVLMSLGLERITGALHEQAEQGGDGYIAIFELVNQGALLSSGFSIIPALLVAIIGEVSRIRSGLYYIVGGGAALAAVPLLAGYGESGQFALPSPIVWQVFGTAGFVGGFVYWLIAGRTA